MFSEKNNSLVAHLEFSDFSTAFAFLVQVAIAAEKMNHHPTITNTYSKVGLSLSTHDAGNTVTDKDHKLAKKIEAIAAGYSLK
jgi:4a-hydroxytetrahydrobiopterin dehydratase